MKQRLIQLLISVALIILIGLCSLQGLFQPWEAKARDLLFEITQQAQADPLICLIEIDEATFKQSNNYFKRRELAQVIEALLKQKVHSIAIATTLHGEHLSHFDTILEDITQKAKCVFYPLVFKQPQLVDRNKGVFLAQGIDSSVSAQIVRAAKGIGHLNYKVKGSLASFPPIIKYENQDYFGLPLVLAADYLQLKPGELKIPLWEKEAVPWCYISQEKFKRYSVAEITNSVDFDLSNKICLISSAGLGAIQASLLNAILRGNFLHFVAQPLSSAIVLILGLLLSGVLLRPRVNKYSLSATVFIIYLAAVLLLFIFRHTYLQTISALLIFLGLLAITLSSDYLFSRKQTIKQKRKAADPQGEIKAASLPQVEGFNIGLKHYFSQADRERGFYQLLTLMDNGLGILIGDAPGDGEETNFYIKQLKELQRSQAALGLPAAQGLTEMNKSLTLLKGNKDLFASVIYLLLQPGARKAEFISAGGNPVIVFRRQGSGLETLSQDALPLGVKQDLVLTGKEVQLQTGDALLLYNSGVIKVRNKQGWLFGLDRLKDITRQAGELAAQELTQKIFEQIYRFSEGQNLSEDLIIIAIKVK